MNYFCTIRGWNTTIWSTKIAPNLPVFFKWHMLRKILVQLKEVAQLPLIYMKPGFHPTYPSENILHFWTMPGFVLATTVLGGWEIFIFFSYRNNKINIKDCEVIFKVDRNKDWQTACFLAGICLAGDGELFHWRYAEKNAQFLFLSHSKYCQNTEKVLS